jgi:hypothetical protein
MDATTLERLSPALRRIPAAALLCLVAVPAAAMAQARWAVVPRASLAWWQVSPNLNHLWATTCPQEPTWRPGEGRSGGWSITQGFRPSKYGYAAVADTINVPLYPRWDAQPVCTEAVTGFVTVADTAHWRGVQGEISVRAEALITGHEDRDAYTRGAILQTNRYPDILFIVDSVVNVTHAGDTLRGTAVGLFSLRDVVKPMTAAVQAWPEPAGLRVLAKFRVLAPELISEYGLSKFALGLGVGAHIWQHLFMGVDLVLRPEAGAR